MIHIVFNEADVAVLEQAIALDESLQGSIMLIRDDYAVGPLYIPGDTAAWQARRNWWKNLLETTAEYDPEALLEMVNDVQTLHNLTKILEEQPEEIVWIWAAQNKHDVSGYYWLVSQLAAYQGRIFILYLNNLPFINEKGNIFYPQWLSQIPPREYLKAKKLARPVTPSEFEIDTDEWQKLCGQQKNVRLLEGGKKLVQFNEDYYDAALDQYVHGGFTKPSRILQQFFNKEKETTGDVYLLWRLKQLIDTNEYEVKGDRTKSSKDFEIRNPAKPSLRKKDVEMVATTDEQAPKEDV